MPEDEPKYDSNAKEKVISEGNPDCSHELGFYSNCNNTQIFRCDLCPHETHLSYSERTIAIPEATILRMLFPKYGGGGFYTSVAMGGGFMADSDKTKWLLIEDLEIDYPGLTARIL